MPPLALALLASLAVIGTRADSSSALNITSSNNTDCSCGYYDDTTQLLWTESIVVYFNETTEVPSDSFTVQSYTNDYEKDWNARYRQSASADNLDFSNVTSASNKSLELWVSPPTKHHVVEGAGIKTVRQDIQYGTFTTLMKSPHLFAGGSSLSMFIQYNESESIQVNMQNAKSPATAWVSTLMQNEFPEYYLGANYSTLEEPGNINGTTDPWDFVEVRVDWSPKQINYTVGGVLVRTKSGKGLPSVPAPITLKHWSIGDEYSMMGPPSERSVANIGWARYFFNTTEMTEANKTAMAERCQVADACLISDMTLRGASPYSEKSTTKWKQAKSGYARRIAGIVIACLCLFVSSLLLANALLARLPALGGTKTKGHGHNATASPSDASRTESVSGSDNMEKDMEKSSVYSNDYPIQNPPRFMNSEEATLASAPMTPYNGTRPSSRNGKDDISIEKMPISPGTSIRSAFNPLDARRFNKSEATLIGSSVAGSSMHNLLSMKSTDYLGKDPLVGVTEVSHAEEEFVDSKLKAATVPDAPSAFKPTLQPRQRVDYLAGLVAVCSLVVTVDHYCSTFVPAITIQGSSVHYPIEIWINKVLSPYVLNQVWVCVFFTTSTRFLTTKFLRDGKLIGIAEKVVGRTFRVMIPITAVVLLEYFLIECGALYYLERLPSITWSTWPYTVGFSDFSNFVSEVLGLVYLIPNNVPQITFNYCTGVLWTIPVQIQGSWVVLLGVIIVKEIKTPWKRFGYYAFNVIQNWYALNWGYYFWLGLMLADMDVTYKWKKYVQARPALFHPLCISLFLAVALALSQDVISEEAGYSFSTHERGIHPDPLWGVPIAQTPRAGYPNYYEPRVNGMLFAVGLQALIELSPFVQKIFSAKVLVFIFPHIFTIYLFHGLIFWSLGSFIAVKLSAIGVVYWANLIVIAIACYGMLFISLSIVTPVVETLGKHMTANIWKFAYEIPAPRRPSLYPFPGGLITQREGSGL